MEYFPWKAVAYGETKHFTAGCEKCGCGKDDENVVLFLVSQVILYSGYLPCGKLYSEINGSQIVTRFYAQYLELVKLNTDVQMQHTKLQVIRLKWYKLTRMCKI